MTSNAVYNSGRSKRTRVHPGRWSIEQGRKGSSTKQGYRQQRTQTADRQQRLVETAEAGEQQTVQSRIGSSFASSAPSPSHLIISKWEFHMPLSFMTFLSSLSRVKPSTCAASAAASGPSFPVRGSHFVSGTPLCLTW